MTGDRSQRSAGHTPATDDPIQFAIEAARIASSYRIDEVRVLDVRGLSSLADAFVLGTGTSDRQMAAVLERIKEHARACGRKPFNVAHPPSANWLLADYVDVVVHLFDEQHREYYDLDGLWGDAPEVSWSQPPAESA